MTVAILVRRAQARPGQHDDEQVLGPCERGALAVGLELARALATDAIAIAAGPSRREDRVLAMALRAGCARGVRVWGDGQDDLDFLGVAEILAAAVRKVGAEHVVCGDRSVDERTGAIGPAVAELLGVPHLSSVAAVRVVDAPGPVAIDAEHAADGRRLTVRVRGPVVLGVGAPSVRSRDAEPSAAVPATAGQAIASHDLDDLGLDPRRLTPRRAPAGRLRPVRGTRQATILPDAATLVARLRGARLVDGPTGAADERATAPGVGTGGDASTGATAAAAVAAPARDASSAPTASAAATASELATATDPATASASATAPATATATASATATDPATASATATASAAASEPTAAARAATGAEP